MSNVLVACGLFRFRLFDVVPVARDAVIEAIDDAMFVLDAQDRLVDLNPVAAHGTERAPDRRAGRVHVDPELLRLEVTHAGSHFAELNSYTLPDLHGRVHGRVVSAGTEDGGRGPDGWWHRPRLQQPAPGAELRPLLHDQGTGQRDRTRAEHGLRDRQPVRRGHRRGLGPGRRYDVYDSPAACGSAGEPGRDRPHARAREGATHLAATILLVEDEGAILRGGRRLLARNRFEVLDAHDGIDALRRFEEHRGEVHLVITDLGLPVLGGATLVRELRTRRPDLRMLILSGDRDKVGETEQFGGLTSFLETPFLAGELLDAVQRHLDEADGSRRAPSSSS